MEKRQYQEINMSLTQQSGEKSEWVFLELHSGRERERIRAGYKVRLCEGERHGAGHKMKERETRRLGKRKRIEKEERNRSEGRGENRRRRGKNWRSLNPEP